MRIQDFRIARCMPYVKRGMRVEHTYNGKKGRIAGVNSAANLNIIFDGENFSKNCHPHWMMRYFDADGSIIEEYGE